MNHGSLFSGIGGFDLAAEWMGWNNVFHCEWNEFGQKVLKHYWPQAISYEDITKTDFTIHRGDIDILTGGFPCQPYSVAGKRKGKEDERHLWPEMLRAIREIAPRYVVGENVRGLVNWNGGLVFDEVQTDLEAEGYEVQPFLLGACTVDAPHRRDRVWFVAYSDQCYDGRSTGKNARKGREERLQKRNAIWQSAQSSEVQRIASDTRVKRLQRPRTVRKMGREKRFSQCYAHKNKSHWQNFPTQSPICGRNDGLPTELDGITFSKWRNESIKGYGNAIVPQVAYQIFKAIHDTQ
ncbi:MAG TPA: DNA (cytosine-5-)-methyltransferase [Candidatus Paceibacterota bacterium]|nr:DNA (cytosine-5-)-methyltransferase [Candidatus Paceibacterota bacterium]